MVFPLGRVLYTKGSGCIVYHDTSVGSGHAIGCELELVGIGQQGAVEDAGEGIDDVAGLAGIYRKLYAPYFAMVFYEACFVELELLYGIEQQLLECLMHAYYLVSVVLIVSIDGHIGGVIYTEQPVIIAPVIAESKKAVPPVFGE